MNAKRIHDDETAARSEPENFFEKLFKKGLTNHSFCYIIALALLSDAVVKKPQKFSIKAHKDLEN